MMMTTMMRTPVVADGTSAVSLGRQQASAAAHTVAGTQPTTSNSNTPSSPTSITFHKLAVRCAPYSEVRAAILGTASTTVAGGLTRKGGGPAAVAVGPTTVQAKISAVMQRRQVRAADHDARRSKALAWPLVESSAVELDDQRHTVRAITPVILPRSVLADDTQADHERVAMASGFLLGTSVGPTALDGNARKSDDECRSKLDTPGSVNRSYHTTLSSSSLPSHPDYYAWTIERYCRAHRIPDMMTSQVVQYAQLHNAQVAAFVDDVRRGQRETAHAAKQLQRSTLHTHLTMEQVKRDTNVPRFPIKDFKMNSGGAGSSLLRSSSHSGPEDLTAAAATSNPMGARATGRHMRDGDRGGASESPPPPPPPRASALPAVGDGGDIVSLDAYLPAIPIRRRSDPHQSHHDGLAPMMGQQGAPFCPSPAALTPRAMGCIGVGSRGAGAAAWVAPMTPETLLATFLPDTTTTSQSMQMNRSPLPPLQHDANGISLNLAVSGGGGAAMSPTTAQSLLSPIAAGGGQVPRRGARGAAEDMVDDGGAADLAASLTSTSAILTPDAESRIAQVLHVIRQATKRAADAVLEREVVFRDAYFRHSSLAPPSEFSHPPAFALVTALLLSTGSAGATTMRTLREALDQHDDLSSLQSRRLFIRDPRQGTTATTTPPTTNSTLAPSMSPPLPSATPSHGGPFIDPSEWDPEYKHIVTPSETDVLQLVKAKVDCGQQQQPPPLAETVVAVGPRRASTSSSSPPFEQPPSVVVAATASEKRTKTGEGPPRLSSPPSVATLTFADFAAFLPLRHHHHRASHPHPRHDHDDDDDATNWTSTLAAAAGTEIHQTAASGGSAENGRRRLSSSHRDGAPSSEVTTHLGAVPRGHPKGAGDVLLRRILRGVAAPSVATTGGGGGNRPSPSLPSTAGRTVDGAASQRHPAASNPRLPPIDKATGARGGPDSPTVVPAALPLPAAASSWLFRLIQEINWLDDDDQRRHLDRYDDAEEGSISGGRRGATGAGRPTLDDGEGSSGGEGAAATSKRSKKPPSRQVSADRRRHVDDDDDERRRAASSLSLSKASADTNGSPNLKSQPPSRRAGLSSARSNATSSQHSSRRRRSPHRHPAAANSKASSILNDDTFDPGCALCRCERPPSAVEPESLLRSFSLSSTHRHAGTAGRPQPDGLSPGSRDSSVASRGRRGGDDHSVTASPTTTEGHLRQHITLLGRPGPTTDSAAMPDDELFRTPSSVGEEYVERWKALRNVSRFEASSRLRDTLAIRESSRAAVVASRRHMALAVTAAMGHAHLWKVARAYQRGGGGTTATAVGARSSDTTAPLQPESSTSPGLPRGGGGAEHNAAVQRLAAHSIWSGPHHQQEDERRRFAQVVRLWRRIQVFAAAADLPNDGLQAAALEAFRAILLSTKAVYQTHYLRWLLVVGPPIAEEIVALVTGGGGAAAATGGGGGGGTSLHGSITSSSSSSSALAGVHALLATPGTLLMMASRNASPPAAHAANATVEVSSPPKLLVPHLTVPAAARPHHVVTPTTTSAVAHAGGVSSSAPVVKELTRLAIFIRDELDIPPSQVQQWARRARATTMGSGAAK